MFNLLVKVGGWADHQDTLPQERTFEYTDDALKAQYRPNNSLDVAALSRLPTLFMPEQNTGTNFARVGYLHRITRTGATLTLEYGYDEAIPPISVDWLSSISNELDMHDWEFSRTHWAIKDVDLFRVAFRALNPRRNRPTVFNVSDTNAVADDQMSAMMPFDMAFDGVYQAIQRAGQATGLTCQRADDIWQHASIIQDIVSLIDRSRIVVGDCSGKNPNVFYEIGIAHALGREVILITQSINDVPFDLRHLRVITYLNNNEGLATLQERLQARIEFLINGATA